MTEPPSARLEQDAVRMRPRKPLFVYDGDCPFCRYWIARWRRITGAQVDYAPYQEVADRFPEIGGERFRDAAHLIEPDGRWSRGAEAVFRSLARAPGQGGWLWLYRHLPGFAVSSEWGYRLVARHRSFLMLVTRWLDRSAAGGDERS